jgi:transcriptional regulator with XRE-family HTH domain
MQITTARSQAVPSAGVKRQQRQRSTSSGEFAAFGIWLAQLREEAGYHSQSQAAMKARSKKLSTVTQGRLSTLETGRNSNPDPQLLMDLAHLYSVPYDIVIKAWAKYRFGLNDGSVDAFNEKRALAAAARERVQLREGQKAAPSNAAPNDLSRHGRGKELSLHADPDGGVASEADQMNDSRRDLALLVSKMDRLDDVNFLLAEAAKIAMRRGLHLPGASARGDPASNE